MTSVHTLCWLPASLGAELSVALQDMLARWTSAWGLPAAGQVQVSLLDADAASPSDCIDLLAPAPASWRNALARALFKLGADESAIVDAVIRRMTDQLEQLLRSRFPQALSAEPQAGLPGHRGVQVSVDMLGQRCAAEFGISQLRAGGWLKAAPSGALGPVNFEQATKDLPVPLVAELGRASISIGELVQLAPGDVLLLEEGLDAPLRMVSSGCSLDLPAHLGVLANPPQRAARWLAS